MQHEDVTLRRVELQDIVSLGVRVLFQYNCSWSAKEGGWEPDGEGSTGVELELELEDEDAEATEDSMKEAGGAEEKAEEEEAEEEEGAAEAETMEGEDDETAEDVEIGEPSR